MHYLASWPVTFDMQVWPKQVQKWQKSSHNKWSGHQMKRALFLTTLYKALKISWGSRMSFTSTFDIIQVSQESSYNCHTQAVPKQCISATKDRNSDHKFIAYLLMKMNKPNQKIQALPNTNGNRENYLCLKLT